MIAILGIIAYLLITLALVAGRVPIPGVAGICLLTTFIICLAGVLLPASPRLDRVAARWLPWVLLLVLAAEAITQFFVPGKIALAVALALLTLAYVPNPLLRPGLRFAVILIGFAAATFPLVVEQPESLIDVWVFQQRACDYLLHGVNPYTADYPNIYDDPELRYGEGLLRDGKIVTYPYPPLTIFLGLPGYLLAGDVRWSLWAAILITAVLLVAALRRRGIPAGDHRELVAVIFLYHPGMLHLIEGSWNESYLALGVAWCAWAVAGRSWPAKALGIGWVVAAKQYGLLLLPSLVASGQVRWKDVCVGLLLAAATAVPFLIWDWPAFWLGTVGFHLRQPIRPDSNSVSSYLFKRGIELPSLVAVAIAAGMIGLTIWQRKNRFDFAAMSAAAIILAFFLFGKQAYFNYYWLVGVLLLLTVGTGPCAAEASESSADK